MAFVRVGRARIAGLATAVPARKFDNVRDTTEFATDEVRKVVAMAGVNARRIADAGMCSSDLCTAAADRLLEQLGWERESVDALIMVTQSPDYLLPSTSCIVQARLGLSHHCAAFDIGLGCSGFPYGLSVASTMLNNVGLRRVLLLHGETPSHFSEKADRSVSLLFGDAGAAMALEASGESTGRPWCFGLHTDGSGWADMLIEGGGYRSRFCEDQRKHFVRMQGANIFRFTIMRVPELIRETLDGAGISAEEVDYFIFHQSNRFIISHLVSKMNIPRQKVPLTLGDYGNTGGPSVALTMTLGGLSRPADRPLMLMLLGYGVGLSWGSALITLEPGVSLTHLELEKGGWEGIG